MSARHPHPPPGDLPAWPLPGFLLLSRTWRPCPGPPRAGLRSPRRSAFPERALIAPHPDRAVQANRPAQPPSIPTPVTPSHPNHDRPSPHEPPPTGTFPETPPPFKVELILLTAATTHPTTGPANLGTETISSWACWTDG
jgi:hypothetical protein